MYAAAMRPAAAVEMPARLMVEELKMLVVVHPLLGGARMLWRGGVTLTCACGF